MSALRVSRSWRGQDGLDPVQRHVQVAEPADHLGDGDLVGRVAPVAGVSVDVGRLEQPDPVVVPQHLDAHMGGAGEVADRQGRRWHVQCEPSPGGRVNSEMPS